ncbi:MAG TPA: 2-amino-4-hydroxy-6-hydroxymethyldihydropteridine diphosphokinase [bacterium]|nr:2-amino-4-hydroxy-6-hydroxymethyldihydropteridine diphosphokinase [Myxococcales bacterium]OQA58661.1 MAG: 2-amino-4-hydroxy-6-hydroxymethyldihydropteridine pyrophosphokinase [bacterium ADurb.Bin270]HPW45819.1 2-amino-4-hydroxy-6-hydroxymethyldihydropteridine diphosphokinase [bacterium]HQC50336.1 2-amino-4-hydroxy-6-hydroxymethyldihydropteridine diphosphokinase [bacterium]HQG13886.1 2-amino-4-hydroxy-6-hydroxymethyldihydropteridine diphosphokinase [bacterium]
MKNTGKIFQEVYIGLGSNLGDRNANIDAAIDLISSNKQIEIISTSRRYETRALIKPGLPPQPDYINAAIKIETSLSPHQLLLFLMETESQLGRKYPRVSGEPRSIDLDILIFGDLIMAEKNLQIPHPELHKRMFVLLPLCDIASAEIHPALKKTIAELMKGLKENG